MRIVWDETKRQQNLVKHELDFANLTADFFEMATIVTGRDGRLVAIGNFEGILIIAVVFVLLGSEGLSIISMRPASRRERRLI